MEQFQALKDRIVRDEQKRDTRSVERRRMFNHFLSGGGVWDWLSGAASGVKQYTESYFKCQYRVEEEDQARLNKFNHYYFCLDKKEWEQRSDEIYSRISELIPELKNKLYDTLDPERHENNRRLIAKALLIDVSKERKRYTDGYCYKNSILYYWLMGNQATIDLSHFRSFDGCKMCGKSLDGFVNALSWLGVDTANRPEYMDREYFANIIENIHASKRYQTLRWAVSKESNDEEIRTTKGFNHVEHYLTLKRENKTNFFTRIMERDRFSTYLFAMIPFKVHSTSMWITGVDPWPSIRDSINFAATAADAQSPCSSYSRFCRSILHTIQEKQDFSPTESVDNMRKKLLNMYHRDKGDQDLTFLHSIMDNIWEKYRGTVEYVPFDASPETYNASHEYHRGDIVLYNNQYYINMQNQDQRDPSIRNANDYNSMDWLNYWNKILQHEPGQAKIWYAIGQPFENTWKRALLSYWYSKSLFLDYVKYLHENLVWYKEKNEDGKTYKNLMQCYPEQQHIDELNATETRLNLFIKKGIAAVEINLPRLLKSLSRDQTLGDITASHFSLDSLSQYLSLLQEIHIDLSELSKSLKVYSGSGKSSWTINTVVSVAGGIGGWLRSNTNLFPFPTENIWDSIYGLITIYIEHYFGATVVWDPQPGETVRDKLDVFAKDYAKAMANLEKAKKKAKEKADKAETAKEKVDQKCFYPMCKEINKKEYAKAMTNGEKAAEEEEAAKAEVERTLDEVDAYLGNNDETRKAASVIRYIPPENKGNNGANEETFNEAVNIILHKYKSKK